MSIILPAQFEVYSNGQYGRIIWSDRTASEELLSKYDALTLLSSTLDVQDGSERITNEEVRPLVEEIMNSPLPQYPDLKALVGEDTLKLLARTLSEIRRQRKRRQALKQAAQNN